MDFRRFNPFENQEKSLVQPITPEVLKFWTPGDLQIRLDQLLAAQAATQKLKYHVTEFEKAYKQLPKPDKQHKQMLKESRESLRVNREKTAGLDEQLKMLSDEIQRRQKDGNWPDNIK